MIHSLFSVHMDLMGVEPMSESPFTTVSTIIVCLYLFPLTAPGKQESGLR